MQEQQADLDPDVEIWKMTVFQRNEGASMIRRSRSFRPAASGLWIALLVLPAAVGCIGPPPDTPEITGGEILWHVYQLSHDGMKGREAGTPECEKAARYIADAFVQSKLQFPSNDGFFQALNLTMLEGLGANNRLTYGKGRRKFVRRVKTEFIPFGFSANGVVSGGVVFAGYGITAPEHDYDDYAGLDVKGKTVLLLRYEPGEADAKSPFNGKRHTLHAQFPTKVRNAVRNGAAAVLIVTGPRYHPKSDTLKPLRASLSGTESVPVVHITRAVADDLLALTDKKLTDLQTAIDTTYKPASFALGGVDLTLQTELDRRAVETRNVIGLLPGSDEKLRDEYVVLGAHYDHIGLGEFASAGHGKATGQIHNGADDNGSGTAVMMEIAEHLAARAKPPRRSILFMAFTAEEKGLVGSSYYTKHPLVPLDKTVAMINLDMVGRLREEKLTVSGVGTSPGFKAVTQDANQPEGLDLKFVEGGNSPSDSTAFYLKKIPVLFFFTGVHTDYHKPSDDWHKINERGAERVARVVTRAVLAIANADERPVYVKNDGGFSYGGPVAGDRAWFGIMPEIYSDTSDGVLAEGVTEGSPAHAGGLKDGDRIVKMGPMEIRNLMDMTTFLSTHKPGEKIPVVVLRGGKKVTLEVMLGKRPE